jgi:two-component system chemotaxis sensor kinase CheA
MILKGKHIFIVEDNIQNRVVFQMALIVHGALIDFERSGQDAVTMLKKAGQVDLIILDLMLKENLSGYDIFQEIRKLPKFDAVPIIAVSAAEPAIAIPKTQALGFSGFIGKPIDDDLFAKQIVRVLAGEHVWYAGTEFQEIHD